MLTEESKIKFGRSFACGIERTILTNSIDSSIVNPFRTTHLDEKEKTGKLSSTLLTKARKMQTIKQ